MVSALDSWPGQCVLRQSILFLMATDELSGKPDEMLEGNLVMKLHPGRSSDTPSRISSCWMGDWFTAEFSLAQLQNNELRNHTLPEFESNAVLRFLPSPTRSLNVYLLRKQFSSNTDLLR